MRFTCRRETESPPVGTKRRLGMNKRSGREARREGGRRRRGAVMGVRSRRWGLGRCQANKWGQEMPKKRAVIFNRIILRSRAARFGRRRCSCAWEAEGRQQNCYLMVILTEIWSKKQNCFFLEVTQSHIRGVKSRISHTPNVTTFIRPGCRHRLYKNVTSAT